MKEGNNTKQLFWVSWYQPTEDHRPLTYPPNEGVLGWWCTGTSDIGDTLVAMVQADSKEDAEDVIKKDWPEVETWRFIEEKQLTETDENSDEASQRTIMDIDICDFLGDRFPVNKEWMHERFLKFFQGGY